MQSDAAFSRCRRYRYALWRRWANGPQVFFVMLNPASADEVRDDPTIRRCIGFARAWGFGALAVGNLFAFRAPSPAALIAVRKPVGRNNDTWLSRLQRESTVVVAAWGNHGRHLGRSGEVRALLGSLHTIGTTKLGEPRHPLYALSDARLVRLREGVS
ncbi:MAG: DUF1643 domain-containing protein [Chromatiales bacterium]